MSSLQTEGQDYKQRKPDRQPEKQMGHLLILSWTQSSVLLVTVMDIGGNDVILENKLVKLSGSELNVH